MDSGLLKVQDLHLNASLIEHKLYTARSEGDGMENADEQSTSDNNKKVKNFEAGKPGFLRDQFIYNPEDFTNNGTTKPPKISGQIVRLKPAPIIVKPHKKSELHHIQQEKEPKFVPYEPYKGAVNPITPQEKMIIRKKTKRQTCPILNIQLLDDNSSAKSNQSETSGASNIASSDNTEKLEKELDRLQKENQHLENQLKFQIQVNGDLKNLLVASVGEDMETRVHILTEDKLHLARALLSSAQKLNTHQEQTEWLAGQCEVWRSKFLASSIMVEELAKWKALLTRRVQDLQDMTKRLLDERLKVREFLTSTYKDITVLCDNFDVTSLRSGIHKLTSSNILDLSEVTMQLSAVVRLQLLGNGVVPTPQSDPALLEPKHTSAELHAIELIQHPIPELENADAAYSAVMGAAVALSSASHLFSPACCGHCTGEIKTV